MYYLLVEGSSPNAPSSTEWMETINALRYLLAQLEQRKAAHLKQYYKKQILVRAAKELGLESEIDQALERAMQRAMDKASLDDIEDDIEDDVGDDESPPAGGTPRTEEGGDPNV
jgi:hypothetical protein